MQQARVPLKGIGSPQKGTQSLQVPQMGHGQGGKKKSHSLPVRKVTLLVLSPSPLKPKTKGHIVIPYTQGLCKSIKKICSKYGIQTLFKGNRTIKNILVSPKDKDPMENKSGVIYWFQCGELVCDEEYIGETSRTFGERFKEHLKEPSPMHNHSCITGHATTQDNFQIIGREDHGIARTIKESIYIRVNNPHLIGI